MMTEPTLSTTQKAQAHGALAEDRTSRPIEGARVQRPPGSTLCHNERAALGLQLVEIIEQRELTSRHAAHSGARLELRTKRCWGGR